MPNTYTQIYIHAIFAVQYREYIISDKWKDDLYKYITGIIQNKGHKMIAINGVKDHIHLFFSMKPTEKLSDLIKDTKANSAKWINQNKLVLGHFKWQTGYGAFSYSRSQIDNVVKYINNQTEHHKRKCFKEEYMELLQKFDVDFESKYLFDFFNE